MPLSSLASSLRSILFAPPPPHQHPPSASSLSSPASSTTLPIPPAALASLTLRSRHALERLYAYRAPHNSESCPHAIPAFRRAAVLLGLFAGRNGELYVILSKRSSRLRSHSGDTALPGGRFEHTDKDLEYTARREAFEETGLPIDPSSSILLCELPPFLSANELVVTPFVVLLTDHSVQPHLNPSEVDSLFSLPLVSFLYHTPPLSLRPSLRLSPTPTEAALSEMPANEVSAPSDWHTCRDILWLGGHRIRRHTFWDERNPIRGLTSDILILAASIAYASEPQFSNVAPAQPTQADLIRLSFTGPLALRRYRVKPRMQFLRPPDSFSFTGTTTAKETGAAEQDAKGEAAAASASASASSRGEELQQPLDDRGDFKIAPPLDKQRASGAKDQDKDKDEDKAKAKL
ncbi:uncharacterized protein PFL1_04185 [Pseudozyma flocculosa PF-1]|uniref:Related to coenzyme A diphosphatase n=2 Tax=Pseudozyma flocculosa TaxID=84751 RepID=A0A5C3EWN2_9BASI|nr:uncharacterized protein PFL1_04185 [Pseudozyma flocculosa PF-1]EPQ28358.1 hypothetical protein PFL1_04185 [Pseudozyma flocculosa PF-1]SPO35511.1 related to coenzyme A diphosphatase [Pseudozyma flocculosa]